MSKIEKKALTIVVLQDRLFNKERQLKDIKQDILFPELQEIERKRLIREIAETKEALEFIKELDV